MKEKPNKPTIKDLAKKAGVSKTTVSFAFNFPERISVDTYQRIMKLAQDMGYSPDPVARSLSKRRTHTLAILFPQELPLVFQNPYVTEVVRGFCSVCDREDFATLLLSPLHGVLENTVLNAAVDGIVILGVTSDSNIHSVCRQRDMPYVTIDADFNSDYVNVGIDEVAAAKKLAELLLNKGHRKICVCTLPTVSRSLVNEGASGTIEARRAGILSAFDAIAPDAVKDLQFVEIDTSYKRAYEAAMSILKTDDRPSAVYCMADIQAYGFYSAARDLGLSIPGNLSVVTFDNLPHSDILTPKPTMVVQPGFDKGKVAAKILMDILNGKKCESVVLPAGIHESDSIADISAG